MILIIDTNKMTIRERKQWADRKLDDLHLELAQAKAIEAFLAGVAMKWYKTRISRDIFICKLTDGARSIIDKQEADNGNDNSNP